MAHKGKYYKLQFRRDLADAENNNDAWPEAFGFTIIGLHGVVGESLTGRTIKCVNLLTSSQPPMVWISDPFLSGGTAVYYRLSLLDPFHFNEITMKVDVIRQSDGMILASSDDNTQQPGGSRQLWFCSSAVWPIETPQVNAGGDVIQFVGEALGYGAYNP